MESLLKEFEHLVVKLEEIKSATDNFNENKVIGHGGFGKVYVGELFQLSTRKNKVAFKRLDRKFGQGDPEFWKEIMMLSRYTHENLISLLGFCNEQGEKILVYEHASNGSLDRHLSTTTLTWTQRIKICLDAAKGLSYLHEDKGNHQRVLHRDIKSSNILLDENWNAKVSDMGLAKIGPTAQYTAFFTNIVGTFGYIDPMYLRMGFLTKESDVYSFGVVLIEVFCGRLCFDNINAGSGSIVHLWKQRYEEKKLDEIIFKNDLMQALDQSSMEMFSGIAFQCLQESRENRPKMSVVVEKLEIALKTQEPIDVMPKMYEEIVKAVVPPLIYRSMEELKVLLSKGVLLNGGKMWFSINDKDEHCVMISIEECLIQNDPNKDYRDQYSSTYSSRFAVGSYKTHCLEFKICVRTPLFLSSLITYSLNLVFRYTNKKHMEQQHVTFRYTLQREKKVSIVHLADKRVNEQLVAQLYQFTSDHKRMLDFEIIFEDCGISGLFYIEGIEFQPLERVEHPVVEYEEILKTSVPPLFYRSPDELKVLLSRGVLLNEGKRWLSINKKGEHCERVYIEACVDRYSYLDKLQHQDGYVNSRFPGGLCYVYEDEFEAHVRAQHLSPQIAYTVNLVFRYQYEQKVNGYNPLRYKLAGNETKVFIVYNTYKREDGWFVAPLYQFTSQHKTVDLEFMFEGRWINLQVAGIEFQPLEAEVEVHNDPLFDEYQGIIKAASQSLVYTSLEELKEILSKGVHLHGYKTWFSLNENGEHCEMISIADCLIPHEDFTSRYKSDCWSRFPAGLYQANKKGFKTHVKTQLLSPLITYTVNLVFDSSSSGKQVYVDLKYRLRGEATTSTVYLANRTKDNCLFMAELYQFTSDGSTVDLEIVFENCGTNSRGVEGILFQPLEKVEDIQIISDSNSDTNWEQTLPNDYEEILKLSKDSMEWTTKKELYSILCRGFLLDNGQQWFTAGKNGKKWQMLSARATCVIEDKNSTWESSNKSRFGEVLLMTAGYEFEVVSDITSQIASPATTYETYLVYKLPKDQFTFDAPLQVKNKNGGYGDEWFVFLVNPPHTPVIGPKVDENAYNPLNRPELNAVSQHRSDGWMEVKVWDFQIVTPPETISMHLKLMHPCRRDLCGLIIEGIELRPI